jgi:hypothetical protein
MKSLYVTFTDAEFARMLKAKHENKGNLSWHEFILRKCAKGVSVKLR